MARWARFPEDSTTTTTKKAARTDEHENVRERAAAVVVRGRAAAGRRRGVAERRGEELDRVRHQVACEGETGRDREREERLREIDGEREIERDR
jgi:hypothetical protein